MARRVHRTRERHRLSYSNSLHYGKQQVMKQSRCHETEYTPTYPYEGFPHKAEVIMTEKARPKYFKPLDIGLRTGDCDYHSPLIITRKLDAIRNHRTRSTNTIRKRSENRREFQDRSQKKRRNWARYLTNAEKGTLWKPRTQYTMLHCLCRPFDSKRRLFDQTSQLLMRA